MKYIKIILLTGLLITTIACTKKENIIIDPDAIIDVYDGTWENKNGSLLKLDFNDKIYEYQNEEGRQGTGKYLVNETDGSPYIEYDGFKYILDINNGKLTLTKEGQNKLRKSMELSFIKSDKQINTYTISNLKGTWKNKKDKLKIDTKNNHYTLTINKEKTEGTINDDHNGLGIYLKDDKENKTYLIYNQKELILKNDNNEDLKFTK